METQTKPKQIEVQMQTTRESQTKALPKEKAAQTCKDMEVQSVEVEMMLEQEDTLYHNDTSLRVQHAGETHQWRSG